MSATMTAEVNHTGLRGRLVLAGAASLAASVVLSGSAEFLSHCVVWEHYLAGASRELRHRVLIEALVDAAHVSAAAAAIFVPVTLLLVWRASRRPELVARAERTSVMMTQIGWAFVAGSVAATCTMLDAFRADRFTAGAILLAVPVLAFLTVRLATWCGSASFGRLVGVAFVLGVSASIPAVATFGPTELKLCLAVGLIAALGMTPAAAGIALAQRSASPARAHSLLAASNRRGVWIAMSVLIGCVATLCTLRRLFGPDTGLPWFGGALSSLVCVGAVAVLLAMDRAGLSRVKRLRELTDPSAPSRDGSGRVDLGVGDEVLEKVVSEGPTPTYRTGDRVVHAVLGSFEDAERTFAARIERGTGALYATLAILLTTTCAGGVTKYTDRAKPPIDLTSSCTCGTCNDALRSAFAHRRHQEHDEWEHAAKQRARARPMYPFVQMDDPEVPSRPILICCEPDAWVTVMVDRENRCSGTRISMDGKSISTVAPALECPAWEKKESCYAVTVRP